ncbi:MAG TPA: MarR family transcriptional regulator [Kofleriaceae bacterium]|jgi:DNA-binding MarR family transcriptional regulator
MQGPPDWDPSNHPAYLVGRAARLFTRHVDDDLRALGFTAAHVPVLRSLSDGAARSQTELAQIARIEQPTMAQMLARMERDGLVRRAPNPADGRSSLFSLMPAALAKTKQARAVLVKTAVAMFDGLSPKELAQLQALMARVVENLEGG